MHQIILSRRHIDSVDICVGLQIRNVTRSAIVDRWVLSVCKASIRMLAETIRQNSLVAAEITGREDYESSHNHRNFWGPG